MATFDKPNDMKMAGGGLVGTSPGQEAADAKLEILQQQIRQLVADMSEKVHKASARASTSSLLPTARRSRRRSTQRTSSSTTSCIKAQYDQVAQDAQDRLDAAQAASDAAAQLASSRAATSASLFGTASLFSRGTSATAISASASRFEQDVNDYATALQALIDAGAGRNEGADDLSTIGAP